MAKYRVYLVSEASATVEVEADSPGEAVEEAFDNAPHPCHQCPEIGEWELLSERYPKQFNESDDVKEIN